MRTALYKGTMWQGKSVIKKPEEHVKQIILLPLFFPLRLEEHEEIQLH